MIFYEQYTIKCYKQRDDIARYKGGGENDR